jgi:hypothetical protein
MDERRHHDAPQEVRTRLFISHSSEDQDLVNALTTLIDSALQVLPNTMRCTSDPRFNLVPGEDVPQKLRCDLSDSNVVVGLLTPSSVTSSYVLMELGAAWGFNHRVIPVLAAGVNFKDIPGPIGGGIHAVRADDEAAMAEVLDIISRECDMSVRVRAGGRQDLVKQFAQRARSYSSSPKPGGPVEDLGNFPAFLPTIVETVKNAPKNSNIQIACDYVGYGMFNAGSMSDEYRNALIQATSRGCTIEMLALGSKPWEQMRAQVPVEHERWFEELRKKEEFKKNLDAFSDRVRELALPQFPLPITWTRASQLDALVQVELHYKNLLEAAGIHITIVSGPLPLYLWITESSAVWALCPLDPRMRFPLVWYDLLTDGRINLANPLDEHGFFSCDKGHVKRFSHVWHQYKPVESPNASVSAKAGQNRAKGKTL